MADEKFKTFKKRYQEGKITTTQMPPLPAGPTGLGRQIAGAAAGTGLRAIRDAFLKQQKNIARNTKRREAAAQKREVEATKKAERAKEKFGPLAKREENLPATQGSRAVVKRKDNLPATQGSRSLTVVREGKGDLQKIGNRSVATGNRTFGDKGQGRIVGLSNKGKLAAGAIGAGGAAAAYAGYKKAGGADAGTKSSLTSGPRDDRASSLSAPSKASDFKSKMQGRKVPGSPTSTEKKPVKAASDKSNYKPKAAKAEKPLSNFERMKARGYEKEGYGGRSMTAASAKAQAQKERGYKFKDLFKKR